MFPITKELIQYWQKNLNESGFLDIDDDYIKLFAEITRNEMEEGKINDISILRKITGDVKDVFICPVLYTKRNLKQNERSKYSIWLMIPAEITYDGVIRAKDERPFIPRKYLHPSRHPFTISDMDRINQYWLEHPFQKEQSWQNVLNESERFYKNVFGNSMHFLQYKKEEDKVLIFDKTSSTNDGSIYNIKAFYKNMLSKASYKHALSPLAQRYTQIEEDTEGKYLTDSITYSIKHLGQMSTTYGLTSSQREALHHFLALQDGELLSIEGPPGTGKTTLLQSVIASLWVDSAYQQRDTPATILASGATNLSITNILEMFQKISIPSDLPSHSLFDRIEQLTDRWIPNVNNLGSYCAAESKRDDKHQFIFRKITKGIQLEMVNWIDLFQLNESELHHWEQQFLTRTSQYFGRKILYINTAIKNLHDALRQVIRIIQENLQEKIDYQILLSQKHKLFEDYHVSSLDEVIHQFKSLVGQHKQQVQTVEAIRREFYHRINNRNPFTVWCSKLPILGKYITKGWMEENQYLIQKQLPDIKFDSYEDTNLKIELEKLEQAYQTQLELSEQKLAKIRILQQEWNQNKKAHKDNQSRWKSLGIPDSLTEAEEFFDKTYRVLAFLLATHYWEARFLETAKQRLQSESEQPFQSLRQFYTEVAMLTPCLISTLHSSPKFFNESYKYLHEFADLLIIDEASQVLPELAFPVFSLAKKALIVGDTNQLPPISNLTAEQDNISLQESGLLKIAPDLDNLDVRTHSSVMKMANRLTRYVDSQGSPFMLQEHFRCHSKIAQSFNHVYYNNKLNVRTSEENEYNLLPMAFVHVDGHEEPSGSSRINHTEASTIAIWVKHFIEQHGIQPSKDSKILAVLTPFSAQANLISSYLRLLRLNHIKVGTVHSLQGAEYKVVLFSPTYSTPATSDLHFFDREHYVLNVAISRAKQSFLIFGNKNYFGVNPETPSGQLLPFIEDGADKIRLPDEVQVTLLTEKMAQQFKQYIREGKLEYKKIEVMGDMVQTKIDVTGDVTGSIISGSTSNATIHNS